MFLSSQSIFRMGLLASLLAAAHFAPAQDAARKADGQAKAAVGQGSAAGVERLDGGDRPAEKDDPVGRREWFKRWFGPASIGYLDYRMQLGERELERWGHRIPGTRAYRQSQPDEVVAASAGALSQGLGAGIPAGTWRNIGPLRGESQKSGANNANIVDTGRITAILPHPTDPSVIYVGYAGGGLWRCRNADIASDTDWVWEPMTDGLPMGGNISIGAAAYHPDDPRIIYIALGDMMSGSAPDGSAAGRGVFVTHDGGATWGKCGDAGKCDRTKTILPLGGGVVLVAGNMGLFRSTNDGDSFIRVQSGPFLDGTGVSHSGAAFPPNEFASAWDILQLDDGTLVATYQFCDGGADYEGTKIRDGWGLLGGGGIAYSTDRGVTWRPATISNGSATYPTRGYGRMSIAACGNILYGLCQRGDVASTNAAITFPTTLIRSEDGGRTWKVNNAIGLFSAGGGDGGQSYYNQMMAVDPQNSNVVFVGTNLSVYRSTNGGANFSQFTDWLGSGRQYTHADQHIGVWTPPGRVPKALYMGTDGGLSIFRDPNITTIPGGGSNPAVIDHRRNRGIATHLIYNFGNTTATTPAGSKDRILIGLQDLGTRLRLADNASQTYDYALGGDGFGCLIHPYNGNWMLGSAYWCQIRRSTNGSSFVDSVNGIQGSGNSGIAPFYTRLVQSMADPTGNQVYTFTFNTPYSSTNFGQSWTDMTTTGPSGWPQVSGRAEIRAMGASPLVPGLIGATFDINQGGQRGAVAISRDNGKTWKTHVGFPGCRLSMADIAFDTKDPDIMYVSSVVQGTWGTALPWTGYVANHLWKSLDGGDTWVAIDGSATQDNGFPFGIPVHVVKVDPLDNQVVYAGTDFGLYRTQNQGGSWERFGVGLPMVSVRDIYIAPDSSFMRVATHGRGVWEMTGVTANYLPVISSQPLPQTVDTGGKASFSAVAVGIPVPTLQWQVSVDGGSAWNDVSGETGGAYSFVATTADNGKLFRVQAKNSLGSTASKSALLTVLSAPPPTITRTPSSVLAKVGERAVFAGAASGAPAPTLQWQISRDGGSTWTDKPLENNYFSFPWIPTNNPLGFYAALGDAGARVRFAATNEGGTVHSPVATLVVDTKRRQLLRNPEFEEYDVSATHSDGYPGVQWTWSDRDGMAAHPEIEGRNDSSGSGSNTTPGRRCARLGSRNSVATDWVYQDVAIPSEASSASLTFRLAVANYDSRTSFVHNAFQALLKDPSTGATLATLFEADNTWGQGTTFPTVSYYTRPSAEGFDLSQWKGKTVRVYFTSSQTNAEYRTSFFLDNVYLDVAYSGEMGANYDIDGVPGVDAFDVLTFLSLYGSAAQADLALADFNGDGKIDDADLALILGAL